VTKRLIVAAAALLLAGCGADEIEFRTDFPLGGDPDTGKHLLYSYACNSCHVIPGVGGGYSKAGPPLDRFGSRSYIAGVLPNTPDNAVRWIMDPQAISPGTAMPSMGITEVQARHMATYLAGLR
jgi:cytochrome c